MRSKEVCAALIHKNGRFLVARRWPKDQFGGLWEFPGGGREGRESRRACIEREIKEELGLEIEAGERLAIFEDEIPALKVEVHLFLCTIRRGQPKAIDCQAWRWVSRAALPRLRLAPIDRQIYRWLKRRSL